MKSSQFRNVNILEKNFLVTVCKAIICIAYSNMASFFRFVHKRAIYRWYNLIRTCAGECD